MLPTALAVCGIHGIACARAFVASSVGTVLSDITRFLALARPCLEYRIHSDVIRKISRRVAAGEGVCVAALKVCAETSRIVVRGAAESGCGSERLNDYAFGGPKSVFNYAKNHRGCINSHLTALHAIIRIGLNVPAVRMQTWIQLEEGFDSYSVSNS